MNPLRMPLLVEHLRSTVVTVAASLPGMSQARSMEEITRVWETLAPALACPSCSGTGIQWSLGPDSSVHRSNCPACNGSGTLMGAYLNNQAVKVVMDKKILSLSAELNEMRAKLALLQPNEPEGKSSDEQDDDESA